MTCIAYDKKGGTISVDSLVTGGGHIYTDRYPKFFHLDGGGIAFFSGDLALINTVKNAIRKGEDWESEIDEEINVIVSYPDGKVYAYAGPIPELITKSEAWGSGQDYAYGAMFSGASSETAVKAASVYSTTCGGKVHTFKTKR